uniref:Uncharacterized protein n=1 Tax=Pristionchus pacificus TaxID=54126 RepID=A0A2A6CVQ3_PRIPA|eukprot:PDM82101.1 hypothetical protein PRIPAC_36494 [Pristionchus pacificus]
MLKSAYSNVSSPFLYGTKKKEFLFDSSSVFALLFHLYRSQQSFSLFR